MTDRLRTGRAAPALAAATLALAMASCAPKPAPEIPPPPLPVIVPEPPPPPPPPPLPRVPVTQSDAEDLWHLRAGLNVAALVCDRTAFFQLVVGYNALLVIHKPVLAAAVDTEFAQLRANGQGANSSDWQGRYDAHMTKVYNMYSLSPQRQAFCAAANSVVAEAATLTPADFSGRASDMLRLLDTAGQVTYAADMYPPPYVAPPKPKVPPRKASAAKGKTGASAKKAAAPARKAPAPARKPRAG